MEILDTGEIENPPLQYAGFWIRFAAALIDAIILFPVQMAISYVFFGEFWTENFFDQSDITNAIVSWIYFAGMESSARQGTLGKGIMKIKVADMDGDPIGFMNATGRFFGKYISALIILIGYIMAAFTEKKQALHDILAGTLVVRK